MSILSPNKPQSSVQKAMDRMFEDFFDHARDWGLKRAHRPLTDFVPAIDMKESGDKVRIKAELPGMDEGDIKVSLDKDVLTIKGEKKIEEEHDEKDQHYHECSYGSFLRRIQLPWEVDREKVTAKVKKGVLKIHLEKAEEARKVSRDIVIQSD